MIILSSAGVFFPINDSSFEPISEGHDALNLSDDELVIITPENKTYIEPMSGYYPATYGFENDENGNIPSEWVGVNIPGTTTTVVDSYNGHNKVFEFDDTSVSQETSAYNYFDPQSYGSVEYWLLASDIASNVFSFTLRDTPGPWSLLVGIRDDFIFYYDGINHNIVPASSNQWYHIRIDFRCTGAGPYNGLNESRYFVHINGTRYGEYNFATPSTEVDLSSFGVGTTSRMNAYVDAVGYSWDPNYNIGDNSYEGLLLSFESSINSDWIGYTLDETTNKTILGNTTIPMPEDGQHKIKVFGNDSLGTMYQSEKRYFTTDYNPINIITPENITYTKPMDGHYPGTFSFESDQNGDFPEGWICSHTGTQYLDTIEVINEKWDHTKVVELEDNDNTKYDLMMNVFSNDFLTKGTIEFWIATTSVQKGTIIVFRDSAFTGAFEVDIDDGYIKFYYSGGGALTHEIDDHKWYHVQIDFNCETDKVTYWLDQTHMGTVDFLHPTTYLNMMTIYTSSSDSSYSSYIDAIGYSWDSNYEIGDNHDEGILFSCDNFTNLEWIDYSLDGQTRQSILGNKTLATPVDGMHSIQFFAQDSLGEYYESEMRYFTIEIAPSVEWASPGDGSTVILPFTKPPNENDGLFKFQYKYRKLDDIELEIDGVNLGSVWNTTSIVLTPYTDYTNGFLSATLIGINNSVIVDTDTRSFQFVKIVNETTEVLNSSTQIIGKQLYLILHDPHGDNSFSSISESTKLSFGVGSEITNAIGVSIEVGTDFKLFGIEMGASVLLEAKATLGQEYDFRYEVIDTTSLTSGQVTDDADYIGPGYGDRYWGESWIYKWVLNGTYREYSNGTDRWEKPKLYYGILRGVETFASDEHAPAEWRNQNAVYNDTIPVSWISLFQESGGATYTYEHEVSITTTRKRSFQIDLGADFGLKFGPLETHLTIELSVKTYAEVVEGNIHKVAYEINDDDPSDFLVQHIGIDERFGTFIFKSESFFCETSHPLEHNTYDYLPPVIDFPTIDFDTNNDDFGPANDDSPLVRVNIFEEGGLQNVVINYTINNGLNWNLIYLDEIIASPGLWEGTIPSLTQGTKVKWYIIAWDTQGNRAERKDIYGNPFEYTVLEKPLVPSYPPMFIILSLMTPIVAFILRNRKKLNKINT